MSTSNNPEMAGLVGGSMEAPRPSYDWYKRGEQDAANGKFDPPSHPDDRAAYDAGRDPDRELNP